MISFFRLIAAGTLPLITANAVTAEVLAEVANHHCHTYVTTLGGTTSVSPIHVSGPTWTANWGEAIPGDSVTIAFSDDSVTFAEQSSKMADHILTILAHLQRGIEVLVGRFDNDGSNVYTLVIPLTEGAEPSCFMEWLSR
jgi:hypothetical protein